MSHDYWYNDVLVSLEKESKFKHSNFMERMIDFQKSIFLYYEKYKDGNPHFKNTKWYSWPSNIFKLYRLKRFLKANLYDDYIDDYLNHNEGWYPYSYIPVDKNWKKVEIFTITGKTIKAYVCGYGYAQKKDNSVVFGWVCWVNRWRFINNEEDEVEHIDMNMKKGRIR